MNFFEILRKHLLEAYTEQFGDGDERIRTLTEFDIDDAKNDASVKALLEYIDYKTGAR